MKGRSKVLDNEPTTLLSLSKNCDLKFYRFGVTLPSPEAFSC